MAAITVDANNSFYSSLGGVLFDKSQTTLLQYPGGVGGSYTIPSSVTSIGEAAFAECWRLTNVTMSNGVTSIGDWAFSDDYTLTSLTIPGSVTSIGDYAFDGCGRLTSLTSVFFMGNAPTADSTVFSSDNNVTVYYLPGTTGWSSLFYGRPAVLWKPVIESGDSSFGVQNNQFGFNINWASSQVIVVEACTNLASPVWTPLQTLTLTSGSYYFTAPFQTNSSERFYRISSP